MLLFVDFQNKKVAYSKPLELARCNVLALVKVERFEQTLERFLVKMLVDVNLQKLRKSCLVERTFGLRDARNRGHEPNVLVRIRFLLLLSLLRLCIDLETFRFAHLTCQRTGKVVGRKVAGRFRRVLRPSAQRGRYVSGHVIVLQSQRSKFRKKSDRRVRDGHQIVSIHVQRLEMGQISETHRDMSRNVVAPQTDPSQLRHRSHRARKRARQGVVVQTEDSQFVKVSDRFGYRSGHGVVRETKYSQIGQLVKYVGQTSTKVVLSKIQNQNLSRIRFDHAARDSVPIARSDRSIQPSRAVVPIGDRRRLGQFSQSVVRFVPLSHTGYFGQSIVVVVIDDEGQ